MSQCVPSWDNLDDVTPSSRLPLRSRSNSNIAPDVPLLDYEVAELTWENGQIAMHGFGPPRVPNNKPMMSQNNNNSTTATHACKYAPPQWDKPRAGGTLESIVNQATRPSLPRKPPGPFGGSEELVPWFDRNAAAVAAAAAANNNNSNTNNNMDAQVPCAGGGGMGTYTQVASCSGAATREEAGGVLGKRVRAATAGAAAARVPVSGPEWSGPAASVSGTSATFGSHQMRVESCERDHFGVSMGSPENASSGKPSTKATAADDHDSVCHSRLQRESGDEEDEDDKKKGKSSISTKRSRAAAIHNQSERKRRDKINQRMKTLQKLVPNSSKTDKASMLDEVIDYLKQLQAQVHMMSRMNMPAMMLPVAMQQQLQLSMMSSMGMGMGMGMGMQGMDINNMARPNLATIPQVLHPNPFMQMTSWDGAAAAAAAAAVQPQLAAVLQDPLSSFFACQSQPMTAEAYSRMAATYQQLHQPPASSSKS